jgi:hypothetical protein
MALNNLGRSAAALEQVERMLKSLRHVEPDRVPISDFFWGGFVRRWREDLGLPATAEPYTYYDLDWVVTIPNLDPHIRSFETVRENAREVVVRTGFETTLRKQFDLPMPEQVGWETDTLEKLEAFQFDDPADRRRYYAAGDNQIAGVGDGFERNSPAWIDTVKKQREYCAVFGSVIEVSECLTRLLGQMNTLTWIGEYPERFGKQILRLGEFYYRCARAQLDAAGELLDGMVIWGDVAYRKSLFFSPAYWRKYFKPTVKAMVDLCHSRGLPVIYHGCGNVSAILPDMIEMGVEGYNPLEAKAGLDVVALRRKFGHQLAFIGNSDMQIWETADRELIRREVLHKLNAAKGGGMVFQSDHSVTSAVSGQTYDYIVKLVRKYGKYPLTLGEFDEVV